MHVSIFGFLQVATLFGFVWLILFQNHSCRRKLDRFSTHFKHFWHISCKLEYSGKFEIGVLISLVKCAYSHISSPTFRGVRPLFSKGCLYCLESHNYHIFYQTELKWNDIIDVNKINYRVESQITIRHNARDQLSRRKISASPDGRTRDIHCLLLNHQLDHVKIVSTACIRSTIMIYLMHNLFIYVFKHYCKSKATKDNSEQNELNASSSQIL